MDTELARTFLSVVSSGNFINAAEHLNVTQSTVSVRIRALEEQLGCVLFVRNKAGTTLTPAGRLFQRHATMLVRAVEQARQDVGVPRGFDAILAIGGRIGLWDGFLLDWLPMIREKAPHVSVRAEIGFENDLMHGLVEGRLDIAVMYTPQRRPGLAVEALFDERLILVSGGTERFHKLDHRYVYIDWGPEFYAKHAASFPDFAGPAVTTNVGWLGLRHILGRGGSGYFPVRLVRPYLKSGQLNRVPDAPEFAVSAYAVHRSDSDAGLMALAMAEIRRLAAAHASEDQVGQNARRESPAAVKSKRRRSRKRMDRR